MDGIRRAVEVEPRRHPWRAFGTGSAGMANLITVGRLVALFLLMALVYWGTAQTVVITMVGLALVIASDGIDGWVARRRNATSTFGAVFDIAGDRIVETVCWVVFADLGAVPIWVPLLVITRGIIVDAVRSLGLQEGLTPFGERNMAKSPLTRWLTAGRFVRALYGYAKAIAFVYLAGWVGRETNTSDGTWLESLHDNAVYTALGWGAVWLAVALTIIRGIPVLVDAWDFIVPPGKTVPTTTHPADPDA